MYFWQRQKGLDKKSLCSDIVSGKCNACLFEYYGHCSSSCTWRNLCGRKCILLSGIGALSYESARYHDYNLLMLLCMMSGILVIFCNIVSQTINEQIDPRMKDEVITEKSEVVEG